MPNFFDKYPYTDFHELNLDWIIKTVKETVAEWAVTLTEWHNTQEEWQQLYDYVHDYFANLDVQQEINNKLDQMALDGSLATIAQPIIDAKVAQLLPGEVSNQIGGAVAGQIGDVVSDQLPSVVDTELPPLIAPVVADWLADHITQPTTPAIDTSLSVAGAAADAKVTGDRINEADALIQKNNLITLGTNLLDRRHNFLSGYYVSQTDGSVVSSAPSVSIGIEITGGSTISISENNLRWSFYDIYSDITGAPSTVPGFISGGIAGGSDPAPANISVPAAAKMCVISAGDTLYQHVQVEYGSSITTYENYDGGVDTPDIRDRAVNNFKLSDDIPKPISGKNLFNKDSSNSLTGLFVNYAKGDVSLNASYSVVAFPVIGGNTFSCNKPWCQYAFFDKYTDISNLVQYDRVSGFISGFAGSGSVETGASIPAGAKMMTVSTATTNLSSIQVEYGSTNTAYESYYEGYDGRNIIKNSIPEDRIISTELSYTLKADGTGDFTNIRDCIDYINSLATYSHIIIYLDAGTYDVRSYYSDAEWETPGFTGMTLPHDVDLVGINGHRDAVVITCNSVNPMSLVSTLNTTYNNNLKNLTIYGNNLRYVIHDDYSDYYYANAAGVYMNVENVDFIGENLVYAFVYGAGTQGGAVKHYKNCRFINLTDVRCYTNHDKYTTTNEYSTLAERHVYECCEFIAPYTTYAYANVRICPANSNVSQAYVFIGCMFDSMLIDSQYTGDLSSTTIADIIGTGNNTLSKVLYHNTHDQLSAPRFTNVTKAGINVSGSTITAGSYVKRSTAGIIAGTSYNNDGIAVYDAANGLPVYFK